MSYKPDVDDARETPALEVARLLSKNTKIRCHDPFVKDWDLKLFPLEKVDGWADILVILSNHKVYASRQFESPLLSFDKLINAAPRADRRRPSGDGDCSRARSPTEDQSKLLRDRCSSEIS